MRELTADLAAFLMPHAMRARLREQLHVDAGKQRPRIQNGRVAEMFE